MSLGIDANKAKNGALLAYIAWRIPGINLRKLLKIIFFIDEKSVIERSFPLTWFDYYAWEKGPVAPEVYDIKNGAFSEYVSCASNAEGKRIVKPVLDSACIDKQMEVYSPFEMEMITDIIRQNQDKTADELTEKTHNPASLWSRIVKEKNVSFLNGKSETRIPLEMLNAGNQEKEDVYADALEYMQFCNAAPLC